MKNLILISLITLSSCIWAQCTDLFFSEYVEGTHNNKALEIFNPTNDSIDLSNYRIIRYSNGATNSNEDIEYVQPLSGFIYSKQTFIVALDRRDPAGTGADTMLFQELLDQITASEHAFYSPDYGNGTQGSKCLSFNGDDAITLEKTSNGSTYGIVDVFGLIGERPQSSTGGTGAGWTDEPKYWDGTGAYWTKDQTLIRKSSVNTGVTTNPGPPYQSPGYFNPSTQWDSLSVNTFDSLGSHTCDCSANSSIKETDLQASISIYPNPVFNNEINIVSKNSIDHVEIFDLSGKLLKSFRINAFKSSLSLKGLNKGAFLLKLTLDKKANVSKNLIIQ
jgi:hypothetical protein